MLVSGSASAAVIGGVDFGAFPFHLDTTSLAETKIDGDGQKITGYGVINTVNGNASYAGTDKLFFIFTDYESINFTGTSTDFTGGVIEVYKRSNFNLLLQSSADNLDMIDDGLLWLTLTGHAQQGTPYTLSAAGSLTGASLSFTGSGLLDVDLTPGSGLPAVQFALNGNDIPDGFLPGFGLADVLITTSANNFVLNPHDDTSKCRIPGAGVGDWCLAGSADLRGTVIPEPSVLALLGIGLLGMASARRKDKAA